MPLHALAVLASIPSIASVMAEAPKLRLPDGVRPTSYTAELTVDPSRDSFAGVLDVAIELAKPVSILWLNGTDITVDGATLAMGGKEQEVTAAPAGEDFIGFELPRATGPGTAMLHLAYRGKVYDNDINGLFRQKEDDRFYLYTHFEAIDARRAFPCFDEPSFKVPWQITLNVPSDLVAASNTPIESETAGARGLKKVRFRRTAPLPSYLIAFAVGPFDVVDAGKAGRRGTPVRILAFKGRGAEARWAAESTPTILGLLEDYFDIPYPYEKLDEVAVPQFLGAMENAGLVTYASRLILSKPSDLTARRQRTYASVCAHELAHQWFGDLVTMSFWDDVWLNESFASWMASKIVERWKPSWGSDVSRVGSRIGAMEADSLATARAIRQPIETKDDIANAFDGITYGKGEAVLEMFESYLGPETFRDAVRAYLKKHAFGNATASDFLEAESKAFGRDLAPAFSSFLDRPGVPLVTAELLCDRQAGNARIRLSQQRYLPVGAVGGEPGGERPWKIPVCLAYGVGGERRRLCVELDETSMEVPLDPRGSCPEWLLPNDGEAGYYLSTYDQDLVRWAFGEAGRSLSVKERVGMLGNLEALVRSGKFATGDALALLPAEVASGDRHIISLAAGIASSVRQHLVPEALRPNYARFIRRVFGERGRALGLASDPGDDDDTRLLRPLLVGLLGADGEDPEIVSAASALARRYLDDRAAADPEMASVVLELAARNGDRALFDRLHEEAKKATDRQDRSRLLGAMASFRDPEIVKAALALTLSDEFEARQSITIVWGALDEPAAGSLAYAFVKEHWDELCARLPRDYGARLSAVSEAFCDEAHAAEAEAFFKMRSTKYTGGPRELAQSLEAVRQCAAQKAAQEESVAAFLKTQ